MKKIKVKNLKYSYRKIVDKEMNNFLNDERTSYLKFIKYFPICVFIFCALLVLFESGTKYGFNMNVDEIKVLIGFSLLFVVISFVYPLALIDKFPRKYYIVYGEVESKRIESDEVTNVYFVKVKGYGKEFTSLSTVYDDIEENKVNIFVISECDNRICMVLNKLIDTETYNDIISIK